MSDQQPDYTAQYNSLVRQYNALQAQYQRVAAEVQQAQYDTAKTQDLLNHLRGYVKPPLDRVGEKLEENAGSAREVLHLMDELKQAYLNIKNVSVATAMLTGCQDKYFTYFGDFNDLRRIALGYVVGVDANLWQTDAPRKKVEKVYLANTDYWLAYAAMSVMLWASGEKDAAEFAVSKSMQLNSQKSSLFYLLVNLRFERIDVARQWFKIYFDSLEPDNVPPEIEYLIQTVLCGAAGRDRDFERYCIDTINALFEQEKAQAGFDKKMKTEIDQYFGVYVNVTDKEYINLGRTCPEYKDMLSLMSMAEKNALLRDYFNDIITAKVTLEDSLYSRIESVLYSLIESYDEKEKALLDEMEYHQLMVKAKGNKEVADSVYASHRAKEKSQCDIAVILVRLALDYENKTNTAVKKFALNTVKEYCKTSAGDFAGTYRGREKPRYPIKIDDWQESCTENDFESKKGSLLRHDQAKVKRKIKNDKVCKGTKIAAAISIIALVITGLIWAVIASKSETAWNTPCFVIALIFLVLGGVLIFFNINQAGKIKRSNQFWIDKNQQLFKDALSELGQWRAAYKKEDAVNAEFVSIFDAVLKPASAE